MLPITVGNSFSQSTETKGRIPLHQRFNSHTGISVPWSLHNLVIWRQAAPPNNLPVKCGGGTPTKALTGQEFSRLKNMEAIAANGCAKMIQNLPNHNYSLPMARPSLHTLEPLAVCLIAFDCAKLALLYRVKTTVGWTAFPNQMRAGNAPHLIGILLVIA